MPHRRQQFALDKFYHIHNRGNNKERIFFEQENYRFFLRKFIEYMPPKDVEIHAYCLMPNHYHFIIRLIEDFDYSKAMQHFGISFAKSMNSWYGRVGHLFQGRFGARVVHSTEYLLHLSRYIHLNPVKACLVKSAQDWEFSSYQDYLLTLLDSPSDTGELSRLSAVLTRPQVTTGVILSLLGSVRGYRDFVETRNGSDFKPIEEGS
jgi:putative transposase